PWLEPLLAAARQALCLEAPGCFVLLHHGGDGEDAAAVARTLHLEEPRLTTCVVETPPGHPKIDEWVCAEAASAVAYQQAIYDGEGRRHEARLTLLAGEPREKDAPAELPLGAEDHLLVTGGGKGIAAECALALGRLSGARLLLAGRSRPGEDPALAAQLARLEAHGIAHNYISTDVTSLAGLRASLERAEGEHGPITGVLHGAGVNEPALLRDLDRDAFRRALAPKVGGLENLLRCLDGGRLRLLVTFGSVIARTGLRGEAHYALANSRQTRITEIFQEAHPDCRCLAVEWSVWSGTGMGERLQTLEGLLAQGITAIRVDEGCAILEDLLTRRRLPVAVVVAGRLGEPPTLPREAAELPLLRFLERPRVFHPGIELVAEAEVSLDSDPYLRDHVFRGEPLLPAVMGLEAMAQAAMAVTGSKEAPRLEGVEIARPVTVGETAPRTIRLAALAREDESAVDVVLRSDETGFQTDHYRARARWDGEATPSAESPLLEAPAAGVPPVPLEPREDLYGDLLFHTGLFQRLRGYRELSARRCVAEVTPCGGARWFHRYLPETLVLGDPGLRDGAIHSIQACVPNASFVPIAVERLIPSTVREPGVCTVRALERRRIGDRFIYDLEVWSEEGRFLEQWRGLHLQLVSGSGRSGAWVEPLLGPYIERAVGDLLGERGVLVAVERNGAGLRSLRSERALARAACSGATVHRRADGKPEIEGADAHVSVAHAGSLTLAVASPGPVACDVEPVVSRSEKDWQGLLGEERRSLASRLSTAAREDAAISATRVWSAMECLTKAGASPTTPLLVDGVEEEGWVVLSAGRFRGATVKVDVRGESVPLVFAVMVEDDGASL
ncbi:MAG: SDR family NAD(P)-dependent oxidoreductase, partial [Planctomycetota bacterium]